MYRIALPTPQQAVFYQTFAARQVKTALNPHQGRKSAEERPPRRTRQIVSS